MLPEEESFGERLKGKGKIPACKEIGGEISRFGMDLG